MLSAGDTPPVVMTIVPRDSFDEVLKTAVWNKKFYCWKCHIEKWVSIHVSPLSDPDRRWDHCGAGALYSSSDSPDLSPHSPNITWFRAPPLSHRVIVEALFLPPTSWCLHHTPDGSACLKKTFTLSVWSWQIIVPSAHIFTSSTEVAALVCAVTTHNAFLVLAVDFLKVDLNPDESRSCLHALIYHW